MPSIEQCDVASGSVAALPSTLEIFDKFKPIIDNGKDSDSEESFHLLLEDDDVESMLIFDIDTKYFFCISFFFQKYIQVILKTIHFT